jgi:hypothetical protein
MKNLNTNNFKYQLALTLLFIFSSLPVLGQTLTISSNGQTGTSGTNWSSSGTNPVTITATGDANINASVVVGYLNAGISVIINSNSNLLIANNIVSTSANSSSLTFKVNSRISQAAGVTVSTNGGNITYWSDTDNNGSGVIEFSLEGSVGPTTISSNGGNITLAGGIDSGGNPGGYTSQIFSRGHFTANSNGGNILLKSISSANFTGTYFASSDFNAGSGSITIDAQQTGSTVALFFAGAVNMTSTKNSGTAISLTGTANSSYGVLFNSGAAAVSTIKSSGGGAIMINGSSVNPSSGTIPGIYLFADVLSGSGDITINGGAAGIIMSSSGVSVLGQKAGQVNASSSNISVVADRIDATATTTGLSLVSSGTGSITSSGISFSSTLDTARLTFGSILSGLTLGKSTNTQAITLSGATSIAGPISLFGGDITLNAGLIATGTNTITLQGSGNVTDGASGFVNATNLRLTGGNVTLNSASNDVNTIAASGVSTLTYVDSNDLTVGVVTPTTGISATGVVSLTGSNISLNTGLTTADTTTGDITINASTVNGSGNIALASGRALSLTQSGNSTYSGIVSGTDSTLTKLGAGTLTLSGVSSYTGSTSITSGGLIFSNNTRPSTTGFTGAGQLTIEPSTSFGTDFNTNSYTYAATLTGLTFGKSGNNRTITIGNSITNNGPIFIEGNTININANVNSTAAAGHLTLKSTGFINQANNVTVTTQGGNQIYWADSDSNNSGTIVFLGSATLQSNGGHITLAGGADSGLGTPAGGAYQLRSEGALTINTGGGDLRMKSVIDQGFWGMTFANAVNLNSGTGSISIDVQQTGTARGLTFNGPTSIVSSKTSGSAIAITASSAASWGLVFETLGATPHPMVIKSTAGGSIDITATGGSTSTPLFMDNVSVLSSSGDININGGTSGILIRNNSPSTTRIGAQTGEQASSSSKVTITGGLLSLNSSSNLVFDTTGQVIIQPSATSFTSPLNTSRVTFGSGITDLTIGKVGNTEAITIGSPVAVSGPVSLFGGALAINSALTATNNTINLNASSSVTQSAALTANNLSLNGTGSFTLNNTANNITTIAGGTSAMKLGSVSFTDASGGLNIGTVGANSGLIATGTILAESLIGDVTLAQNITTDNTTSNAVVVNAGKSSAIGTTTGGNILISGTPTITMGTGGIAKLYSGSEAASTGLTTLVGGLAKTRFSADEGTTTFSPVLAAGNSYAIYRSTVPASPTNLVATAGNAQISIAFTAGADGGGSITNYEYTINGGTTWIAASPAITSSPLVITGLTNYTTYTVQIRAVNNAGAGTASASVSATPFAPDTAPSDITLSASTVYENVTANTNVGTFSSTDVNVGDTFTYTLVTGNGDTDNGAFNISGANLRITASPDFEIKSSYNVRVRTTDQGGLFFEKAFTITVIDVFDTPTITVSSNTLTAFSKCAGSPSVAQTFTVSGSNLTSNLIIAAYTNLEYSLDDTTYSASLSLTPTSGSVATTTIYVRMTTASTSLTSGTISVTSTNATTQTMAVSGTVNAATGITVHPNITAQSECQDTALNALSVTAIGSSLTYQWYSNTNASTSGSNLINGATSTSYTPVNSSPSALFYYCIVTGTCGTVTSNLSGLITISATPVAGTASATATTFCSGNSTTLSLAGYTGSIQWQQSSTINGTYTNISGATAANYISPALTDTTFYRALVSSGVCTAVTSNVITITVASVPDPPTFAAATIQSFTTLGSSNWTAPLGVINVEYLVVGGGGGGGNGYDNAGGGGGGAGMVLAGTLAVTEGTVYPITIGDGGVGGANSANPSGSVGQNTIFGSKTAFGGGNGLGSRTGGIAGIAQNSNSSATGGSGSGANNGGKGGGGALGNGTNNSGATGGTGGTGISSSIIGTATTYGIGGNGGNNQSPATSGVPGTSNRGNGGRGATATGSSSAAGGKGGSGIVILKYFSHSSAVSYCLGATATALTATATTGNTLQWYTAPTGGTATTTAPTPNTTISGTTIYYVSQKNDVSGCESARATISVTISATNTWTGTTNNFWNEASNWSCGVVPNSSNDIVISSGTPTLNTDLTIPVGKSLTISGTGTLTIAPGKTLTIAGTADFGGKSVIFQSDATGSGQFGPLTGTVTGVNNIQVERYIPSKRAFRFLSPSVTTTTTIKQNWQENAGTTAGLGTHITGTGGATNGFDVTATNNPSLFTFTNGSWSAVTNTNVNVLTAGTPYRLMVRGDRTTDLTSNTSSATATTLRATGTLKTGNFTPTLNQSADGFSLIGNPYQAPIDIKAILTASTNMSSNVVYYWDPTLNARGGYVTRDLTTDVNDVTSSFNQYVQPGQAVFVKKDNTANVPTMTITEANKSVANASAGVFRNTNTSTDFGLLRVNLQANNQTIEGALALFNDNYTWNVTSEDATKMSNLDEEVSFVQNNTNLAIALQSNPSATSELPIKIDKMRHTNYQWQFELNNYSGATPYLYDNTNNSYTQINNGTVVPFTVDSTTTNRFKIVFQNGVLSNATFDNELAIYPNPAKSGASFYADGITEATVTVYNLLGQTIPVQTKSEGTTLQVTPNTNLSQGVYLVNITSKGTTQQVKWIVE